MKVKVKVGAELHLVHHRWLQVNKDGSRHMLAGPCLGEEGVEGVVAAAGRLVRRHCAVRLDAWERKWWINR